MTPPYGESFIVSSLKWFVFDILFNFIWYFRFPIFFNSSLKAKYACRVRYPLAQNKTKKTKINNMKKKIKKKKISNYLKISKSFWKSSIVFEFVGFLDFQYSFDLFPAMSAQFFCNLLNYGARIRIQNGLKWSL